ncbi:LytR/AlgR family response regulator transcription factor [Carboxylicivirga sp. N1Y90]|uniref:LytR/AlgR family response regulator transcription factor n=1 Tax=Carboxylicivirga fragile TaxID=3417571 RepID=UPI003D350CAC|nr:response regulator transcription factor [Marinilabiliaceae bacterium N1Y90]
MSKVINCIIVDDEATAREVIETHLKKIDQINIVASCKNALEAFKWISSQSIDLVFLDINMPEISGLDFAKTINPNIKIIFTTAYRDYAVEGFDLKAVDYLLKPIAFNRLLQSVQKYLEETPNLSNVPEKIEAEASDFIFVRSDRKMIKIVFKDIKYVESLSDYIKIHLDYQEVVTRETISNIEAKLPAKSFIRTHRSYLVSLAHISSFTHEYIEMEDATVPISRGYKNEVISRLESL